MAKGKKLNKVQIKLYKQIFLEFFKLKNGLDRVTFNYLNVVKPEIDIRWSYQVPKWLKEDPEFKLQYDIIELTIVKWVEDKLYVSIDNGSVAAIKFYLERKAGYLEEKTENVNHNINEPVSITIVNPDKK